MTRAAILALLFATWGAAAPASAGPAELPCIPTWARNHAGPAVGGGTAAPGDPARTDYLTLVSFATTSDIFSVHHDPELPGTLVFVGDYPNNRVVQHTVAPDLTVTATPLPIDYGLPWAAADLDRDGHLEIVLQRGDPGMGGNGYLDIHSAPTWELRHRFVLAGMKVYNNARAVDIDDDPHLEVHLTPSSLSGAAQVMLIDYNAAGDDFFLAAAVPAMNGAGGPSAIGDFDGDGNVEILTGHYTGYTLFEYAAGVLTDHGAVLGVQSGNWGSALRPRPDDTLYALLGHSSFDLGYTYHLLRPTGDNTFTVDTTFQEVTGWAGIHPSYPLDADLDGLQEFVMSFYPIAKIFEWNEVTAEFQSIWTWDQSAVGTFVRWGDADCDQDGVPEWCSNNHNNLWRAYEDADVSAAAVSVSPSSDFAARLSALPNPVWNGTEIRWRAAAGSAAAPLQVLDLRGRIIATLAAPAVPRGTRSIRWNARDAAGRPVPAGTYWVRSPQAPGRALRLTVLR